MAMKTYSATLNKGEANERTIEVEYDFGDNLENAVAKFGEKVVFSNFEDNAIIALQAFLRSKMKITEKRGRISDDDIKTAVASWKPGAREAADPAKKVENIKKAFGSMSEADRALLLQQLMGSTPTTVPTAMTASGPTLVKRGKKSAA